MEVFTSVQNDTLVSQRRTAICEAALRLSQPRGFAHITTRDIAAEAGMNIATMYQYVRTKEDIIYLVCLKNMEEVLELISQERVDAEKLDLPAVYERLCHVVNTRRREVSFVYLESHTLPEPYRGEIKAKDIAISENIEPYVRDEWRHSSEKEVKLLARLILETAYTWANKYWFFHEYYTAEEYRQATWTFLAAANGDPSLKSKR